VKANDEMKKKLIVMDIHELDYMIENPNYMHDFVLS